MAIFQAYQSTNMLISTGWVGLENYYSPFRIGIMDRTFPAVDRYGAVYNGSFQSDFDTGRLLGGTVVNYVGLKNNADQFVIEGISAPILEIYRKGDILDTFPGLFSGHDAINGSSQNDLLAGFAGQDTMNGGLGNDSLYGGLGDDVFIFAQGEDVFYGEEGFDRLYTDASRSSFSVTRIDADTVKFSQVNSTNSMTIDHVERIYFSNKNVIALDVGPSENAGEAYRMYQAAFKRSPDEVGLSGWINFLDQGHNPLQMANQFIASQEFQNTYGNLDNTSFVQLMYNNVLNRNGEASGVASWVNALNNGMSRAEVLRGFSESQENVANLEPIIGNGISYNEWWT